MRHGLETAEWWLCVAGQLACGHHTSRQLADTNAPVDAAMATRIAVESAVPVVPRGMVWIAPGPLVVGTPPNLVPRRVDRDLPGEQFMLHGFYMDVFAYPNEEGAIPTTNVTQADARALCNKLDKRLCTELEWERACKGPAQHVFEYGDHYSEDTCGTGTAVLPRPSGFKVGCRSDFGVHDMHGDAFEWTNSRWLRGTTSAALVAVRGGNDTTGELVARCANAESRPAEYKSSNTGFRCCRGPVNEVAIVMPVERGDPLTTSTSLDKSLFSRMLEHTPAAIAAQLKDLKWDAIAAYTWRPLGNERLRAFSMCSRRHIPQGCGILLGQDTLGVPVVLGFAETGFYPSKLYLDVSPDDVWVIGTDAGGPFRRLIHYNWGALEIGPAQRNFSRPSGSGSQHKQHKHAPRHESEQTSPR